MKFSRLFFASCLGTFVSIILVFLVGFFILIGMIASSEPADPYIKSHSVLKINMQGSFPERPSIDPFNQLFSGKLEKPLSLIGLQEILEKAAVDENISAIWIQTSDIVASWARLEEARHLFLSFKQKSGKPIIASTNDFGFSERGYFVATAADSIYSPPNTNFEFDGLSIQAEFYDGFFKKFGIQEEVSRKGKYKSAVEPYFRKNYSPENREQLRALISVFADVFLEAVTDFTGHSRLQLDAWLNEKPRLKASWAIEHGFITRALFPLEVEDVLKQITNAGSSLTSVSAGRYARVSPSKVGITTSSNKISVLHFQGEIMPQTENNPFQESSGISTKSLDKMIKELEKTSGVKAIVLRIDSPGGAATTSDLIWQRLKNYAPDIPMVVSMGGVAASGGYYIAAAGQHLVADRSSITGSIGVFSAKFNIEELMNENLGITFDEVNSHPHANWLNFTKPFTNFGARALQESVDETYQVFLDRVAENRDTTSQAIHVVAQGRVLAGEDALKVGLIDEIGGLAKAVERAAERAGLDTYSIQHIPAEKELVEIILEASQNNAKAWLETHIFNFPWFVSSRKLTELKPGAMYTLLPWNFNIK